MVPHRVLWILGLLLFAGCHSYPDFSDQIVDSLSKKVRDQQPGGEWPAPEGISKQSVYQQVTPRKMDVSMPSVCRVETTDLGIEQIGFQPDKTTDRQPQEGPKKDLFVIPDDLPGAKAKPIVWSKDKADQDRIIKELYPDLPQVPPPEKALPGPEGRPLTLADLQSLATANNPTIKGAAAAMLAARGAVIQAGAYPNPSIFWEQDTVGTAGAGYQGGGVDQVIKGAGKIKLARAMAIMDLRNAELALRRAESDLATQVRTAYFATLVNRDNVKVSRALALFTDNIYRVQVHLLGGGVGAAYEPMQLRPLALQARLNLTQASNQYLATWRQLAAALGLPNMPLTELAGSVDLPVPVFDYETVANIVLNRHTDVLTALNNVQKARYNEELARENVYPDPDVHFLLQKDYTTPPHFMAYSASVTVPIPVWDQNHGNILQAKNQLTQAIETAQQTKLGLASTLADAINRYASARENVRVAMEQIQDQVRVYRGIRERREGALNEVGFGDVVTAQQTLAGYITGYITALSGQWQAVVDIANLLQTDDLFQTGMTQEVLQVPQLEMWPSASASSVSPATSLKRPLPAPSGPELSRNGVVLAPSGLPSANTGSLVAPSGLQPVSTGPVVAPSGLQPALNGAQFAPSGLQPATTRPLVVPSGPQAAPNGAQLAPSGLPSATTGRLVAPSGLPSATTEPQVAPGGIQPVSARAALGFAPG